MHTFLNGCNTSIEAKNKQTWGCLPAQCIRSSPALACLLHLTSLCTLTVLLLTSAPGMPFPFLPCFKPEGRWHLLLEALPELLRPCPGVHIHTALFLRLGLPECGVKSFPSVSPARGALQTGALSGIGGTPLLLPPGLKPLAVML